MISQICWSLNSDPWNIDSLQWTELPYIVGENIRKAIGLPTLHDQLKERSKLS